MGVAQTGRPMTGVIEKTVFAEMWECAGVCHKHQRREGLT